MDKPAVNISDDTFRDLCTRLVLAQLDTERLERENAGLRAELATRPASQTPIHRELATGGNGGHQNTGTAGHFGQQGS